MKRMIDDGMLDTAAKSFIKHYEGANASTDAPSSENSYFTSIKVAKAKAGARRSINRTIRICAVAAVLMVGLVCALFMGAEDDDKLITISYTKDAYMFKNFDTESEWNMPVKVTVDLKEIESDENKVINDSVLIRGNVEIKDLNGNIIIEYKDVEDSFSIDTGSFIIDEYIEMMDGPIDRDENGRPIVKDLTGVDPYDLGVLRIYFENEYKSFMMLYHEKGEVTDGDRDSLKLKDAVIIVYGANSREEAVAEARKMHREIWSDTPNYDEYGERFG